MSQIKGKDTGPEVKVRSTLHNLGFRYRKHDKSLPGKPDIVFSKEKVVIFIDGDFWHGYRFPLWKKTLSAFWQDKIEKTRNRDTKYHKKLKKDGWTVMRIWQHEIERDLPTCVYRIIKVVQGGRNDR